MATHAPNERIARRLKVLREQKKMTQDALASALGFNDRQTLQAIEAGKRRISPQELVAAAHALTVELDVFLDPFRLVGEGSFSFRAKEVDDDVLAGFEAEAGRWIATYVELGVQAGAEPRHLAQKLDLTRFSSFEDAAASAEWLWSAWKLGDVPADSLGEAVERELDALVLYVDAPAGISGAASHLPGLNTILVNRNEPSGRRSFDLSHELFHLLTWDAMPPRRVEPLERKGTKGNRVEQMAESFAAALLMPAAILASRWNARGGEPLPRWMGRTAAELRVSVTALRWRLVNLGLITARAADEAVKNVPTQRAWGAAARPLPFSRRFVARVADAVDAGRLSLRRAASLLGLTVVELAELCEAHGRSLSYDVAG